MPHAALALWSVALCSSNPLEYFTMLSQPFRGLPHTAQCCPRPLEYSPMLPLPFRVLPHAALCCPSPKKCLSIMFLPLRLVPFLKIQKTVFLYSFWGVAATKHKKMVCTLLIRHFGTSFEPVLRWGKNFSKGALCIPTSLYFKHSALLPSPYSQQSPMFYVLPKLFMSKPSALWSLKQRLPLHFKEALYFSIHYSLH